MKRILVLCVGMLLFAAASAGAQEPAQNTYGGAGDVLGDIEAEVPVEAAPLEEEAGQPRAEAVPGVTEEGADVPGVTARGEAEGALPFTGLDLALLVAGGLGLLAMGVSVRRLARTLA